MYCWSSEHFLDINAVIVPPVASAPARSVWDMVKDSGSSDTQHEIAKFLTDRKVAKTGMGYVDLRSKKDEIFGESSDKPRSSSASNRINLAPKTKIRTRAKTPC